MKKVLKRPKRQPFVVGIAGGTASGKTSVAQNIEEALAEHAVLIDLDSYYKDLSDLPFEERRMFNFDHPDAFDFDLLKAQLDELADGRGIDKPRYSFVEHTRTSETLRVESAPVILLEGILVLQQPELRDRCHMKIYVDTADDVRLARRLTRDIKDRGRAFETVIEQYMKSVRPMHYGFVEPSKRFADIIVPHGGDNQVAVAMIVNDLEARLSLKKKR
jgi:uridine kinase